MRNLSLLMLVLVACGDGGNAAVDAPHADGAGSGSGSGYGSGSGSGSGAGSGTGSGTAKSHTLFLQPEGVTFTPGANDATHDTSSLPAHPVTLSRWRANDASRTPEVAALEAQIAGVLAPYDIVVTTSRPASGAYHEIIVTDDKPSVLASPGLPDIERSTMVERMVA